MFGLSSGGTLWNKIGRVEGYHVTEMQEAVDE